MFEKITFAKSFFRYFVTFEIEIWRYKESPQFLWDYHNFNANCHYSSKSSAIRGNQF